LPCETSPFARRRQDRGIADSGVVTAAIRSGVGKVGATAAMGSAGGGTAPARSAPHTPKAAANTPPLTAAEHIIILAVNTGILRLAFPLTRRAGYTVTLEGS
jgi:hypothetical protein